MLYNRIDGLYYNHGQVQLTLTNPKENLVFSQKGILMFNHEGKKMRDFIDNPNSNIVPYVINPMSEDYIDHIFNCGEIYVRITHDPVMGKRLGVRKGSIFSFMLFEELSNGDVVVEEQNMLDFPCTKFEYEASKKEVEKTFKKRKDEQIKCIYDRCSGVKYFATGDEAAINGFSLPLTRKQVEKAYKKERDASFFAGRGIGKAINLIPKDEEDIPPEITEEDLFGFSVTKKRTIEPYHPIIVSVGKDGIVVSEVNVKYLRDETFLVTEYRRKVALENFTIFKCPQIAEITELDYVTRLLTAGNISSNASGGRQKVLVAQKY